MSQELVEVINVAFRPRESVFVSGRRRELIREWGNRTEAEYHRLVTRLHVADFKEFVEKLSFTCSDVVERCKIVGENWFDCCNGAKAVIFPHGICYILNLPAQRIANNGVQILAKVLRKDQKALTKFPSSARKGVTLVFLGTKSKDSKRPFFIGTGEHTIIDITMREMHSVNNPPLFRCRYKCSKPECTVPEGSEYQPPQIRNPSQPISRAGRISAEDAAFNRPYFCLQKIFFI